MATDKFGPGRALVAALIGTGDGRPCRTVAEEEVALDRCVLRQRHALLVGDAEAFGRLAAEFNAIRLPGSPTLGERLRAAILARIKERPEPEVDDPSWFDPALLPPGADVQLARETLTRLAEASHRPTRRLPDSF